MEGELKMEYSIKPEEKDVREARRVIEGTIPAVKSRLDKEEDIRIELGWTEEEFVKNNMNGVSGYTPSSNRIEIEFNSSIEGWKKYLKSLTAHEFAHTVFFESLPHNELIFNWQYVIFEAHSQNFADRAFPDIEQPWRNHIDENRLKELWPNFKDILSTEMEETGDFMHGMGKGDWPQWFGYSLSYKIGEKLLEDHELEDFPGLKRQNVLEAGEELFGE